MPRSKQLVTRFVQWVVFIHEYLVVLITLNSEISPDYLIKTTHWTNSFECR